MADANGKTRVIEKIGSWFMAMHKWPNPGSVVYLVLLFSASWFVFYSVPVFLAFLVQYFATLGSYPRLYSILNVLWVLASLALSIPYVWSSFTVIQENEAAIYSKGNTPYLLEGKYALPSGTYIAANGFGEFISFLMSLIVINIPTERMMTKKGWFSITDLTDLSEEDVNTELTKLKTEVELTRSRKIGEIDNDLASQLWIELAAEEEFLESTLQGKPEELQQKKAEITRQLKVKYATAKSKQLNRLDEELKREIERKQADYRNTLYRCEASSIDVDSAIHIQTDSENIANFLLNMPHDVFHWACDVAKNGFAAAATQFTWASAIMKRDEFMQSAQALIETKSPREQVGLRKLQLYITAMQLDPKTQKMLEDLQNAIFQAQIKIINAEAEKRSQELIGAGNKSRMEQEYSAVSENIHGLEIRKQEAFERAASGPATTIFAYPIDLSKTVEKVVDAVKPKGAQGGSQGGKSQQGGRK